MSDMSATVEPTTKGFAVCGYEKIEYDFEFLDGVFNTANPQLFQLYSPWGRCLAVMDLNIFNLYGNEMQSFACAAYRRNTNYIRIPTTVIGLIDASVSIKVAVNYGRYKNRLGAYHAPSHTFLDFTFLRSLPVAQIRNGFAELIKISTCAHKDTYDLLEKYCEQLINTGFGRSDDASPEIKEVADKICRAGIHEMLKLETPNLHEIMLDRVIAYGHTWSPLHELVPETPLRHGHAISIDMAYSATLAHIRGLLSSEEHARLLNLFSRAGLSMDHPQFDAPLLEKATAAILKTRDGKLRAAVPVNPMGDCVFLNDVSHDEMVAALEEHKKIMKSYPRQGAGLEAFVDSSDTGYTMNGAPVENGNGQNIPLNGVENAKLHASGPEGVDGLQQDSSSDDDYVVSSSKTNGHQGKGILSDLKEKANGLQTQIAKAVTVESQ
ncbi:hypothetical protein BFJ68_g2556 [Fusarium oxysporum]|uniref:Uncharacterized protein n=1 Tax=Fusarium oxysporum TaxID=5507 RepID=A0A420RWC9_FUSOX|nr:hypothetical protein BFJ68_g2556 [Fusarium oxysporum]